MLCVQIRQLKNEFYVLAQDVVTRWLLEKEGCSQVGRVLPENYLFFASHKKRNRYRQGYSSKKYWDWSLPNPLQIGVMFIRTLSYKIPYMKGDDVVEFQTLITRLGIRLRQN